LNLRAHRGLSVVVDYPENLAALDRAALVAGKRLDVLVDFSAGHHRTGCATEADLAALASAAVAAEGLTFRGVQSYSGNLQHIPVRAERRAKAAAATAAEEHAELSKHGNGARNGSSNCHRQGVVITDMSQFVTRVSPLSRK